MEHVILSKKLHGYDLESVQLSNGSYQTIVSKDGKTLKVYESGSFGGSIVTIEEAINYIVAETIKEKGSVSQ